jgi:hypothetical protein
MIKPRAVGQWSSAAVRHYLWPFRGQRAHGAYGDCQMSRMASKIPLNAVAITKGAAPASSSDRLLAAHTLHILPCMARPWAAVLTPQLSCYQPAMLSPLTPHTPTGSHSKCNLAPSPCMARPWAAVLTPQLSCYQPAMRPHTPHTYRITQQMQPGPLTLHG